MSGQIKGRISSKMLKFYSFPAILFVCATVLICHEHQIWGAAFFVIGLLALTRFR